MASRPGSGKAERYLEFLASGVLPLVDRRYRTAPDRTLSGLGGLFGTYALFHRPGLFQRYLIGSPSYLYADGAALRWPGKIGSDGARPSGVVATSVGTAEPAEDIAAWRDFWDEVDRRQWPDLHILRTEIDETHAAGAWVGLVKGLKAVFAMSPPAISNGEKRGWARGRARRGRRRQPRRMEPPFFHPRGFHGSQWTHTLRNALEDTAAALAFMRASQAPPGIDTGRIAVMGYSYGGSWP